MRIFAWHGESLQQRGVTLIEVLVVTSIFVIALSAMLSSAVAQFSSSVFSGDFLIATNLAREAVEVVRNRRDYNFQNGLSFRDGFDFDNALVKPDLTGGAFAGRFAIEEAAYTIDECIATTKSCQMFFNNDMGVYGDPGMKDVIGGDATKFYRALQFQGIQCDTSGTFLASGLCASGEEIGVRVIAEVKWYQGGALREVRITPTLYNFE